MSGPTDVKPALTDPQEESIGPRDLTHWRTRLGAWLVGLVNHVIGAYARWTLAVIAGVGALAAVLTTALAAQVYESVTDEGELAGLDQPILEYAVGTRTPFLERALTTFTDIGGPVGMPILATLAVAVMVWRWRSRTPLVLALVAAAGSLTMTTVGKRLIGRSRPPRELAVPPFENSPSFPSGHTLNATVIIGVLVYVWLLHLTTARARTWAIVVGAFFVLSMGLSRVYLGHHWLTDVVAGWLIGLGWLATVVTAHRLHLTVRRRRALGRVGPDAKATTRHTGSAPAEQRPHVEPSGQ
jgi:membrane-associated phospholipid phosphatase